MKFSAAKSLEEIANFLGCEFVGNPGHVVKGINEIHKVEPGDLVFVDHPKYYDKALNSQATTILIDKKVDCPEGKGLLISRDPFKDYNKIAKSELPFKPLTASVGENTFIAQTAIIQPNVTIGNNVKIGEGCILHPGVVIYDHCIVGDNVVIHGNTVIGADAFYFQKREGQYHKMHTCGRVIIEANVEIGSACTIDRGVSGDTVIGAGSKLDNQVHIGHDSVLGKNCLLAGQVGLAGCVTLKDNVTLWGQVGVISGITIDNGAVVYGQSGVSKDLESSKVYFGSPAMEARDFKRQLSIMKRIPDLLKKL